MPHGEWIDLSLVVNVLFNMGHRYKVEEVEGGFAYLECAFPEGGGGGPYELVFDISMGRILVADVLDAVEGAGIDRSVFLTHLDALG